jgi:hypothetical protein
MLNQICMMMTMEKKDLEHQVRCLQRKLEIQEKQIMLQKSTIEEKDKEVSLVWESGKR